MAKKITFDTLKYAKKLMDRGIIEAASYAEALSDVLSDNIYTTHEIDMKFEEQLKQHELEIKNIQIQIEKSINRQTYMIIGAFSGIMVLVSALVAIAHNFLH